MFAANIARDRGLPPIKLVNDAEQAIRCLLLILVCPIGQRVEMRRWWSVYDANRFLDRWWHTMLVGLILVFLFSGKNPWDAAMHCNDLEDKDEEDACAI